MLLWYNNKPSAVWNEALPIGNGYLGGLVYGKLQDEKISLNETSFWSGSPHDYDNPNAGQYYKQIQDLVFARKFKEAEQMIDKNFHGKPVAQQAYQPLGDLRMLFFGIETYEAVNYYRDLNMETGVTTVSFTARGTTFKREAFISYPDNVLVVRLTADKPNAISVDTWLESFFTDNIKVAAGNIELNGQWEGPLPQYWLIAPDEGKGMKFQTVLKAVNDGGTSTTFKNKLRIRNADSVTLLLTSATSYVNYNDISGNPVAKNIKTMDAIAGKDYKTLYDRHVNKFSSMMGRVHLNIGDSKMNDKPINERIAAVQEGVDDPNLEALSFQFGRYMLVSSSREGGQTATLQAIWNERLTPPWGSKYTINININMNYWPAEVTNLSECHIPLFDMLKETAITGAKTAKVYYGIDKGWVLHHNTDIWRGTAPVDAARYGMWPVGGAWLATHIWEHYAFTQDKAFLQEYYPIMKGAAEFLVNVLVKHPTLGYMVTPFSMSPEHGFYDDVDNSRLCYVSPGPIMDIAIMRNLFPNVIEASKILKVDAPLRKQLEKALTQLPPYKINKNGYPQEWIEDFEPQRGGHDVSPYFPIFPGNSVQLHRESDKELIEAYQRWMATRINSRGGFGASWNICMFARMERGDITSDIIKNILARNAGQFLTQGTGAQVDAPFGYTAGMAECLIQSHAGELSLLPALPARWQNGDVSGLRGRGNYEVNLKWNNGKLVSAEISNPNGGICNIRYNSKVIKVTIPKGEILTLQESSFN
ncbi:glycosyl hydrolase family 95 catalytic domain-containing protein [Bacteroides uniformis]|uniref:glycoside hydrolase family 95 protein n=1 Tax=Bacteroides uniformis TaxID=820 RepID=UPI00189900B3|nr:glycoside hydrolase family 95 protein [Bacteroides uniformis]